MYLYNLKLWNFRKFGKDGGDLDLTRPHLCVDFGAGVNLLVGENDSGKSTIIDAIKLVLRTHSIEWVRVEAEDFYQESSRLRIECVFTDLKDDEAKHFIEWLSVEQKDSKVEPFLRLILDVRKTPERILPYEVKAGSDAEGRTLSADAKDYLKATYLRPLRDAKAELIARKNSRLSQILYSHPVFKEKEAHTLVTVLSGANEKIKEYFEKEADKGTNGFIVLETLKKYLASFLRKGSSQNAKFHIDDPKLKNILEILKLTLNDERSGLGTYNLLFIAAELLHLKKENYTGLKLGLIEEIEAHLHPQAQLRVMAALDKETSENGAQLILSTHSPNLASKVPINNLILCHGDNVYPLGDSYTNLKSTDYSFLERFLDVTKANLFFAQGVILVEGDAENILVPTIAKLIGKDLSESGVSVIKVGGIIFLRYAKIFQRKTGPDLKIPVSVITDSDISPDAKPEEKTEAIKKRKEKFNGQSVKTFVAPEKTLEYCLALSPYIRELLFNAIKSAGEEMTNDGYSGKKIVENWTTFKGTLSDIDLAKKLYSLLTDEGKKISKAITAQHLAELLDAKYEDNTFRDNLKKDNEIDYIVQAIVYATSYPNN